MTDDTGPESLIREAALSDLWFAYAEMNYRDTGRNLGEVAEDFLESLDKVGVSDFWWERAPHDGEWLIQEYYRRT